MPLGCLALLLLFLLAQNTARTLPLKGYDPGVICRLFAAIVRWLLGYPEQALQEIHTALGLARELAHVYTFVCVLHFASRLHQLRREAQAVQERAEAEI